MQTAVAKKTATTDLDVGEAALREDLARNASIIPLEQIDPRALIRVVTDTRRREYALTDGNMLRQCWESNQLQRVSPDFKDIPPGADKVRCPDGKIIFIKFSSTKFQLLEDPEANSVVGQENNMPAKTHNPPPKKKVAPVKPATSKTVAKETKPSTKKDGDAGLSVDANRSTLRAGLKPCDTLDQVVAFMIRAVPGEDVKAWEIVRNGPLFKQLGKIHDAESKGKGKWMLNRVKSQLL